MPTTFVLSKDIDGEVQIELAPEGVEVVMVDFQELEDVLYDGDEGIKKAEEVLRKLQMLPQFGQPKARSRRDELINELTQMIEEAREEF